jgi:hypothetical protein
MVMDDYDLAHKAVNNWLSSVVTDDDPSGFWGRLQSYSDELIRQRKESELEQNRWEDDGGRGIRTEQLSQRDIALGHVRQLGKRFGN